MLEEADQQIEEFAATIAEKDTSLASMGPMLEDATDEIARLKVSVCEWLWFGEGGWVGRRRWVSRRLLHLFRLPFLLLLLPRIQPDPLEG
jgi:hypothetical protein